MTEITGPRKIRRIVTGHDEDGKAVVISDGPAPNVRTDENRPNWGATELWVGNETPASNAGNEDTSLRPFTLPPPDGGSVFRILELPPASSIKADVVPDTLDGASQNSGRHAAMHKTRTIDYALVLEGEADLILGDTETRMKAGDTLVQRGTVHAWNNPGDVPCLMMFVLIDAEPI